MFVHHAADGVNTLWYMKRPRLREAIREAMNTAGISHVTDLVELAGVARNTVYNWEAGKSSPALDELDKVARTLGVPLSRLVDAWSAGQEEEPPGQTAEGLADAVVQGLIERLDLQNRMAQIDRLMDELPRRRRRRVVVPPGNTATQDPDA